MASYFGQVSKESIIAAVRERISPEAANNIAGLHPPARCLPIGDRIVLAEPKAEEAEAPADAG